jgi:hypothetical protein
MAGRQSKLRIESLEELKQTFASHPESEFALLIRSERKVEMDIDPKVIGELQPQTAPVPLNRANERVVASSPITDTSSLPCLEIGQRPAIPPKRDAPRTPAFRGPAPQPQVRPSHVHDHVDRADRSFLLSSSFVNSQPAFLAALLALLPARTGCRPRPAFPRSAIFGRHRVECHPWRPTGRPIGRRGPCR